MNELPKGWAQATLADLGDWSSGGTPSRSKPEYFSGDIPFVKTGDLHDNWLSSIPEMISESGLQNSSAKLFPEGTLLIAMYGATIGKTARLAVPAATNQACAALLENEANSDALDYVWAYLRSQLENLRAAGKGGAQPNISQTLLKSYPIPIPPLTEQTRIVKKLDTLSARSATARSHLTAITKLVERYRSAVLASAFRGVLDGRPLGKLGNVSPPKSIRDLLQSDAEKHFESEMAEWNEALTSWENGPKTEKRPAKPRKAKPPTPISEAQKSKMWSLPQSWDWVQIGSMAFVTKLAGFEYTDYVNYDDAGDLPVLKAENAGLNGFKSTNYSSVVSSTVEHLKRSQIFGGEVLVVFVGAGVGNVAAVPTDTRFFLGPNIGMVRPYGDHLDPKYLEYFLRSAPGKSLLLSEAKAVAQPSISMGAIRNTPVPMCQPDEQREIVRWIETAFAKIDRLAAEAEKALKLTDRLDQRILAKAYAGELVPQDPNDEPASALLERIREARANAPKKPRKKPTKDKSMKVAPQERVLTDSAEWPEQGLPFEDIAKRITLPHDDLKDAVFALLEGDAPKLRQEFDTDAKVMKLVRVTS